MVITASDVLVYMSLKYNGDYEKCVSAIKKKEKFDEELFLSLKSKMNFKYITLVDKDYPQKFKEISSPPLVLYYYGNIDLLKTKSLISIVGTRNPTLEGETSLNRVLKGVEKISGKICLVSGMAKGIDGLASRYFILNNMPVISILGSGINNIYPFENKDIYDYCKTSNGLLLSEYPFLEEAKSEHFPFRNRIIASLCNLLLVGESKTRSGTSITASLGVEFGKEVYCIPSSISNENQLTNTLIKDGAYLCTSSEDYIPYLLTCYNESM